MFVYVSELLGKAGDVRIHPPSPKRKASKQLVWKNHEICMISVKKTNTIARIRHRRKKNSYLDGAREETEYEKQQAIPRK